MMKLPRGYQAPELVWAVELLDEEGGHSYQLGVFFSKQTAEACRLQLEVEGYTDLALNMIPVHTRLEDWQFDR